MPKSICDTIMNCPGRVRHGRNKSVVRENFIDIRRWGKDLNGRPKGEDCINILGNGRIVFHSGYTILDFHLANTYYLCFIIAS